MEHHKWFGAPTIKIYWQKDDLNLVSGFTVSCWKEETERWVRILNGLVNKKYAVVTDGEQARIIDMLKGSLVSESIGELLSRQEALTIMKDFKKIP